MSNLSIVVEIRNIIVNNVMKAVAVGDMGNMAEAVEVARSPIE